jgi:hypothetical protein
MRVSIGPILAVALLAGCARAVYEPRLRPATSVPEPSTIHGPLKAHLQTGDVVVFTEWRKADTALVGLASRYDMFRRPIGRGSMVVPLDSIALLETEVRTGSRGSGVAGMAVWTVLAGVGTAICLSDPKACFGSCPTFYVAGDSGETLAAEGFSASIARALEATDLDALHAAREIRGGRFTVRMRDEALETHAIRSLRLLAVPRPAGNRVFAANDGRLFPARAVYPLAVCQGPEGDCSAALAAADGLERTSAADSADLATRETIVLTFPAVTGRLGLVLAARQSLMSTYLFYETMGFLGTRAGEALAALERGGPVVAARAMGMARLIAPVGVEVWDGDGWIPAGVHDEAGPLAVQIEVIPFAHQAPGPVRVRLTAAKGAWRVDWVALAELGDTVAPVTLAPEVALRDGVPDDAALHRLLDPAAYLVTYPGDAYDIVFRLPDQDAPWELFLESRGYYYEWMRAEWLADEDAGLAVLALSDPASALRVLAPSFKRAESLMEERFWSSRFGR